jgi:hypothetical protein
VSAVRRQRQLIRGRTHRHLGHRAPRACVYDRQRVRALVRDVHARAVSADRDAVRARPRSYAPEATAARHLDAADVIAAPARDPRALTRGRHGGAGGDVRRGSGATEREGSDEERTDHHTDHGLSTPFRKIPASPAATMISGSWSFLNFTSRPTVTRPMMTVGGSTNARRPRTNPAPAMAPVAAAVTPSTKALMLAFFREAPKVGRGDDREQEAGAEGRERRDAGADRAGDEVADERDRDDDRTRRDHRDRDGVEELLIREPVEAIDDAAVEEGHDGEAAAEHERASLGEVPGDRPQRRARGWACEPRDRPERQRQHAERRAPPPTFGGALIAMASTPLPRKSHTTSDSVHAVTSALDREERPEQAVLRERHLAELPDAPSDDRDDRGADAVERAAHPRKAAEAQVERREREHHQERRQDEREPDQRRSEYASAHPAEVDRELRGEGAGSELREREPST